MDEKELLNKALDYIVEHDTDLHICEALDEKIDCANDCYYKSTGLNRQCVAMYLETIYVHDHSARSLWK